MTTIGFFCEEHQVIHIDGVCPTNWEPPENYELEQVTLSEAELRAKGLVRWNEVYPGVQRWHGNIWILDPREKPID